jgi:hypothetical protein
LPAEFQPNLAFSKACIIESAGPMVGLSGAGLFIDNSVLDAIQHFLPLSDF